MRLRSPTEIYLNYAHLSTFEKKAPAYDAHNGLTFYVCANCAIHKHYLFESELKASHHKPIILQDSKACLEQRETLHLRFCYCGTAWYMIRVIIMLWIACKLATSCWEVLLILNCNIAMYSSRRRAFIIMLAIPFDATPMKSIKPWAHSFVKSVFVAHFHAKICTTFSTVIVSCIISVVHLSVAALTGNQSL